MIKVSDFKIRDYKGKLANINQIQGGKMRQSDYFLTGEKALFEYIRQKCSILKGELWWDKNFGLNLQDLSENTLYFWIRENLNSINLIKQILEIDITKQKERVYTIKLRFKTIENDELVNNIELVF